MLEIQTWENDADHYKTQTVIGVEEQEIQQYKYILELFKESHCNNSKKCGNEEWDIVKGSVVKHIANGIESGQLTIEFIKKVLFFQDLQLLIDGDEQEEYDLLEGLQELLGYPVEYDSDFLRVVESVKLFIIDEPIVMPDVKRINML
ncbi:hypothetical protein CPT_Melville_138 [Salmonella phage Melville]|nr:hypothetical protein FDI73_gp263 [Salmonella phage Melville]ATN93101.1 hypothetical protein CPT_Melville_138 [Salmonella phage Melville]UPW42498.1 hypothetical protein EBPHNEJP_00211 [Salmonella phage CF-SP2]